MLKLKPLNKNIDIIRPYIKNCKGEFNELTLGSRFLWGADELAEYDYFNDALILRETYDEGSYFYFPLGDFEKAKTAVKEIENYAIEKGVPLNFCCLNASQLDYLKSIYPLYEIGELRDWADYVYPVEQFLTYSGKKLSGQRNHVHKFNRTYPDYKVNLITESDKPLIKKFLDEFAAENELDGWAAEEMPKAYELLDNMDYLDQFGIFITVGGKIISLSIGEIVGETLFVHIEKALKEYAGAYPKTAQEFAKTFYNPDIKWINREEDCGDLGLRTSKTQYHPCEIRMKPFMEVKTVFDKIQKPFLIKTERLEITENFGFDGFCRLCTDQTINKFWGFDYRDDISGEPTDEKFKTLVNNLKDKKEEFSLAVKNNGNYIGEIVLWDFNYQNELQIGFRFFKKYQGLGYATESVKAVVNYLLYELKVKSVKAYCYKENLPSVKLLQKTGFDLINNDEKYYYYKLTK
ncbi:MAG: GNAT family N-acetyltransferase [Clostridia bacterium]|nr:GNAT family N-acetyltransferase [Clostridia bacterium]